MNYTRNEVLAAVAAGVVIGAIVTHQKMAFDYNKLAKKYNMLIERDSIKTRVFEEMLPQLPKDYVLSRKSLTDIAAWRLFTDNDL